MSSPAYYVDHICLAVRNVAAASAMLQRMLGYEPLTVPTTNTRQKVLVQFMRKAGSLDIKLIQPSCDDSPLVDFIKRSGGGLHHIALMTESVDGAVADLVDKGAKLITPSQPGEAFGSASIAFAFLGMGLNVELIDSDVRMMPFADSGQT